MRNVILLMFLDVGAPFATHVFATDARGARPEDCGGYGLVCTAVSDAEAASVFRAARTLGFTVPRVSSDLSGLRRPEKALVSTTPYSTLPDGLLAQERWHIMDHGKWRHLDHINLGEGRAVVRLARRLATDVRFHRRTIMSLEDNSSVAGSFGKGRSPSRPLNFLVRQFCASALVLGGRWLLPWVETLRQPADSASRLA